MSIKRSAGILLPISSLPSRYGIGTLGKSAYDFIDFLERSRQSYWQVLPIGPTSYGDSPYASFSSYAGNPYFIDLDLLIKEGLLTRWDVRNLKPADPSQVDYGWIYQTRFEVLRRAFKRGFDPDEDGYREFCRTNRAWLDDYALYMAVKKHFGMVSWLDWPDEAIRLHQAEAIEKYRAELKEDVDFFSYLQYLFAGQYGRMREYAHQHGIKIIGDLPIYVALDSADVWAAPFNFQLDSKNIPVEVAGVPPDYFSEDGQLWGNPLYDWGYHEKTGYKIIIEDYTDHTAEGKGLVVYGDAADIYRSKDEPAVKGTKFFTKGETATITVSSDLATVLAIHSEGSQENLMDQNGTYARLYATQNEDKTYTFTFQMPEDGADLYLVAGYKGDADINKNIQLRDSTILSQIAIQIRKNYTNLAALFGDADADGQLRLKDSTMAAQVSIQKRTYMWDESN